jgi:hypothetical protein
MLTVFAIDGMINHGTFTFWEVATDSLEHKGLGALAGSDVPAGKIADGSFETLRTTR